MSKNRINVDRVFELVGKICDEGATQDDLLELDSMVKGNPAARKHYLGYCQMHSALRLELRASRATLAACQQISSEAFPEEDALFNAEQTAPSVCESSPAVPPMPRFSTFGFFSEDLPLAYLVATVITGLGLLIGAFTHVSQPEQMFVQASKNTQRETAIAENPPLASAVGQITGMVDCKWFVGSGQEDSKSEIRNLRSAVSLGDRLDVSSGLLEITYDTGARVILQGPVHYEVNAKNGGFLSRGKLTGKVESAAAKGFDVLTPAGPHYGSWHGVRR